MSEALQFYTDKLIIEAIISNPRLSKQAQSGMVSSLLQKVFEYAHSKFNEVENSDHKVEMAVNFLVPGILTAFGFPVLGFLSKVAQMMFHIDFAKIFEAIGSSVKSLISGGAKTSSEAIDAAVSNSISNSLPPEPTEDDVKSFTKQNKLSLNEAMLFKIAMQDYASKNPDVDLYNPEINIKFAAGLFQSSLATFVSSRNKTVKILITIIGWIVKAILAAGGFMVAGDMINKIVGGNSNAIDGSKLDKKEEVVPVSSSAPQQAIFKPNPNYVLENNNGKYSRWIIQSDISSIDSILISWTVEIYPDLKGRENDISSSRSFQSVVSSIKAYNAGGPPNTIFIPRQWKSRKQIVDIFVNEIAQNHTQDQNVKPIPNFTPENNSHSTPI